ncbi:hypothetical protein [Capnocytophaga leadbetteri]|jgi:hypothetical protein|uniref:hypothetical protein n=1 Tax=Capnocytophaga leadbetteri TaxID=327575 RepID=UPI0026F1672F|nr:hypothetical protein [Capnocytophaga leadbetteri]
MAYKPRISCKSNSLVFSEKWYGELYQAKELDKIKEYIIEKAKELNEEYPRCKPLNISFAQYSEKDKHHLCGFEFDNFILMPAYLIKL